MNHTSILPHLPHRPGVYLMRDNASRIIYIGKARDLKKRVSSYFSKKDHDGKTQALVGEIRHIDYVPTASEREALVLERRLIQRHKPIFNIMWKDDKSYPYLVLTYGEDFPRVYLTRKKTKIKGAIYFGPYPSVRSVRKLLRWIWRRKLIPLRPCKFDFDEKNLPDYKKVKSCLYLHTEECPAPCVGKISSLKYKKIAKRAKWLFEGKVEKLIKQWETQMRSHSRRKEYEKAAVARDLINTVHHMQEPVTFREMDEKMLQGRIQGSRAVQDLRIALKLSKSPERIECFDISHIQGSNIVASMVSFYAGRPDKTQYRRYVIKSVEGVDDFKSMAEVVGRRYRRLRNEKAVLPDLVLIDGGKGQLSAAMKALKNEDMDHIPVAALAKAEEEIFLPNQPKSIKLPLDSAALLLLRHIRDEAHRFAINFHRLRRGKQAVMDVIKSKIM